MEVWVKKIMKHEGNTMMDQTSMERLGCRRRRICQTNLTHQGDIELD